MNRYRVYVGSTYFGSCYGWYNTRLFVRKLQRKYKGMRVWKEKIV